MLRFDRPFAIKRYLFSFVCVGIAALLTIAILPVTHGRAPLVFFAIGVVLSAANGGVGPGLVSTALGVAVAVALFREPELMLVGASRNSPIVFTLFGIATSAIIGYLKDTNLKLLVAKQRLEAANQNLAERSEALNQANEELQRFAYVLAHDLNAPLRGIAALTDLFIQRNADKLDQNSKECAAMIDSSVQRMQSMIKGLLDYATAVEKPGAETMVDCNAVVQRVLKDLKIAIEESRAEIRVDPLPAVCASEGRLHHIFANLIANAIKYRPSMRRPQIHIFAYEQEHEWIFCVRDFGIGFDMKYADEIFGMFKRLHAEGEYEGSGIGLAICKILIERAGGRIWVESEPGKGSRFFFSIPKRAVIKVESDRAASRA